MSRAHRRLVDHRLKSSAPVRVGTSFERDGALKLEEVLTKSLMKKKEEGLENRRFDETLMNDKAKKPESWRRKVNEPMMQGREVLENADFWKCA